MRRILTALALTLLFSTGGLGQTTRGAVGVSARGEALPADLLLRAVEHGRSSRYQRGRKIFAAPARPGALSGRRIALSAGHGIRPDGETWNWQREITQNLREDIHTNQLAIEFVIPLLERAGAEVVTMRERSFRTSELLLDDDDSAVYDEVGEWQTSETPGWSGGRYRYAWVSPGGEASARWRFRVSVSGDYPVYVHFLSSGNRSREARYTVRHHGGESERVLDQGALRVQEWVGADVYPNDPPPSDAPGAANARWHFLGVFPFAADEEAEIRLSNAGWDEETVVVADSVRVGADASYYPDPANASGEPRWREAAIVFLATLGLPEWLLFSDVSGRPMYAVYDAVDAYLSLHTNCCNSTGTSTYTWYPDMWVPESSWPAGFVADELPPGTYEWADAIHRTLVSYLRASWDPAWRDMGHLGADFGELRPLRRAWLVDRTAGIAPPTTIPGALVELAFHDTAGDASLIREQNWRRDVGRAVVNGMIRYFAGSPDALGVPLAPDTLAFVPTAEGAWLEWRPPEDTQDAHAAPAGYRVYLSSDGVVFPSAPVDAGEDCGLEVELAPCETIYARVASYNQAGESLPSPVLAARRGPEGAAHVLWVNGVDREVKTARDPDTLREYARLYGEALHRAHGGRIGLASATDEAVGRGLVALGEAAGVLWSVGETSVADGSIRVAERTALRDYVETTSAPRLAVSGAEIGWDLVAYAEDDSELFFSEVLGAEYVADDGDAATVTATADSPYADVGSFAFGRCDSDSYCVEWPDIVTPVGGGSVLLTYGEGDDAAAVAHDDGGRRSLFFGFPLETIANAETRRLVLARTVELLVDEPDPDAGSCAGTVAEPGLEPALDARLEPVLEPILELTLEPVADAARPDVSDAHATSGAETDIASSGNGGSGGCRTAPPGGFTPLVLLLVVVVLGRRRRRGEGRPS